MAAVSLSLKRSLSLSLVRYVILYDSFINPNKSHFSMKGLIMVQALYKNMR